MGPGWSETIPYERRQGRTRRPYLPLTLEGLRGTGLVSVAGLVDTGADKSVLPMDFVEMLGYREQDLRRANVDQLQGSVSGLAARKPCIAFVKGVEEVKFEMKPLFVDGPHVLWGRGDLMKTYEVCVSEKKKELTLRLP